MENKKVKISFERKPVEIPVEYRSIRVMTKIILVIHINSNINANISLNKIHLLIWALLSKENMNTLLESTINQIQPFFFIHFDPRVNRACNILIAEDLIEYTNHGNICLTPKGVKFAETVINSEKFFDEEIVYLKKLGRDPSEKKIKKFFK